MDTNTNRVKFKDFQLLEEIPAQGSEAAEGTFLVGYRTDGNRKPEIRVPLVNVAGGGADTCKMHLIKCSYLNSSFFCTKDEFDNIDGALDDGKIVVCALTTNMPSGTSTAVINGSFNVFMTLRSVANDDNNGKIYSFSGSVVLDADVVFYNLLVTVSGDDITADMLYQLKNTQQAVKWSEITEKPEFTDVATTGDYNDLTGMPDGTETEQYIIEVIATGSETANGDGLYKITSDAVWKKFNTDTMEWDTLSTAPEFSGHELINIKNTNNYYEIIRNLSRNAFCCEGLLGGIEIYCASQPSENDKFAFLVTVQTVLKPESIDLSYVPRYSTHGVSRHGFAQSQALSDETPSGCAANQSITENGFYVETGSISHNKSFVIFVPDDNVIDTFYIYNSSNSEWEEFTETVNRKFITGTRSYSGKTYTTYSFYDYNADSGEFNTSSEIFSFDIIKTQSN